MPDPLFLGAALFAEIVGTMVGFGSSTIFLPLAVLFLDFKSALVLVAILHIFGNFARISLFKQGINRQILLSFGLPSVTFSIIGALLVGFVSQAALTTVLGLFLVVFGAASLFKPDFSFKPNTGNAITGGVLSGFLAGLIGTGGAMRSAFLTAFKMPKEKYIATAAVIALGVDLTRIPVYFRGGFLDPQYYFYIPLLLLIAWVGTYIGRLAVRRIPQKKFRTVVLLALTGMGMYFIFS